MAFFEVLAFFDTMTHFLEAMALSMVILGISFISDIQKKGHQRSQKLLSRGQSYPPHKPKSFRNAMASLDFGISEVKLSPKITLA